MLNYLFVELQMIDATISYAAAAQLIEETNIKPLKVSDRTKIERNQGQKTKTSERRIGHQLRRRLSVLLLSCPRPWFCLRILGVGLSPIKLRVMNQNCSCVNRTLRSDLHSKIFKSFFKFEIQATLKVTSSATKGQYTRNKNRKTTKNESKSFFFIYTCLSLNRLPALFCRSS